MAKIPNGKMTLDGTELRLLNYEVSEANEWTDTTDTGSDVDANNVPYQDKTLVKRALSVRGSAIWDSAQDPKATPPNINAGEVLSNVLVYVGKTSSFYTMASCNVERFTMRSAVGGNVEYDFELTSQGTWSFTS